LERASYRARLSRNNVASEPAVDGVSVTVGTLEAFQALEEIRHLARVEARIDIAVLASVTRITRV